MAASRLNALARTIVSPTTTATAACSISAASRTANPSSLLLRNSVQPQAVRMASSSARKFEWLVVVPDKPGTLAKRLEVRPAHFEGIAKMKDSGTYKMGGAILDEMPADDEVSSMKFAGSTIVVVAESREAVLDILKNDVYVGAGVWDLDKAQIWPAKIAFRVP